MQPIVNMRVNTVCTASHSAGKWSSPTTTGPRPPPSSDFTFTAVNHHKAVYFGGHQPGHGYVDDVYIINFEAMVHMIRVHALEKCVDSSNSIQTLEIGHIPMASGILQSYPSHVIVCTAVIIIVQIYTRKYQYVAMELMMYA